MLDYIDKNWDEARKDWVHRLGVKSGLGNATNNRLESINGQIKDVSKM